MKVFQAPFVDAPPPYQLTTEDQAVLSQTNEMDKYEAGAEKSS